MQKRIVILTVCILLSLLIRAQQNLNFPEVDKTSYDLYLQGNWKELIKYAGEARGQGIDFFYLQARTGIAYYNLKRYRTAGEWFLKAWENDQSFEWLQEYLYYSLVFGGRTYEAYKIADGFTPGMKKKIGYASRKLTGIGLEAGYSFNPDFDELKTTSHRQTAGVGENYGEAFYLKNYHFESLDVNHRIAPAISINHNFTYLGINREQHIDWGHNNIFTANTNQFQYFINSVFVLGKKWHVAPSLSLIWGTFSYMSGGISGNRRFFENNMRNYNDLVFSAAAWTHLGKFSTGMEYSYGNITDMRFSQYSFWVNVYPFSNLNFYLTPTVYLKDDEKNTLRYNTFGISGGLKMGTVQFYGQYLQGDMENFIESAGLVVSNFPGTSRQKMSGSLYFPAHGKYRFVMRYITQNVTETYSVYTNGTVTDAMKYSYNKHTYTVGISWNF